MTAIRKFLLLFLAAVLPFAASAGVTSYSTTPANNNSAPPNGAPEGMTPGSVNDVIRQVMADIAVEAQKNQVKNLSSVAGTNTITGNMSPALTAYSDGMIVTFQPAATNTGAVTLAINGLSATTVNKLLNGSSTALVANDLVSGAPALVIYDASASAFRLVNPYSGEWSAGALSTDIARLSQGNTFTNFQTISLSTGGLLELDDSNAAANERRWRLLSDTGQFCIYTATDAGVGASNAICADRTGTTVDSIALTATTVTVNGQDVRNTALFNAGTLAVARGGTGTTTSTGTGNTVLSASPTFTGTVTAATLNATTLQQGGTQVQAAAFLRVARMRNTNAGAGCTQASNSGITSCTRSSAGRYTIDYTAAGFSSTPVYSIVGGANTNGLCVTNNETSTTVDLTCNTVAGSAVDTVFSFIAMGT
jgi:hypothetical protein